MSRETKWHPTPPPPPSPKILHLPRRRRTHLRKQTRRPTIMLKYDPSHNHNLENLFYQDQSVRLQPDLLNLASERRQRVEEREDEEECGRLAEDKWRFQAEMLRAECNSLRMEREHAFNKLEKKRVKMETTLRSAVQTLLSGRKKIEEGKNGTRVLEEEIEDLEEKIEELQKSGSRLRISEVGKYSNFQKEACLLQRGLEKVGVGGVSDRNVADSVNTNIAHKSDDHKSTDKASRKEEKCSGRCKAMVVRIMEQVRAETEQWSQMQNMLDKVRGEMEEMQASRDYWELQARNSDHQIQSLSYAVEEWKEKALDYEKQVKVLQLKLSSIKQKTREDRGGVVADLPPLPLGEQLVKERLALKENKKTKAEKDLLPPLSLAKQIAKEKRSLIRGLRENVGSKQELSENGRGANRLPLRNIANSSLLERQSHRKAFDCRSPESSRIRESFRK